MRFKGAEMGLSGDMACDVVQVSGRYLFAAAGVPDNCLESLPETTDYVLYVFETERKASELGTEICRMIAPKLVDVDLLLQSGFYAQLGDGVAPASNAHYPHKIALHSETGFAHDPMRVFESAVAIVEAGDWGSAPRAKGTHEVDENALRDYTPPRYNVKLGGTRRTLKPWQKGRDENKNVVYGWTAVRPHTRHKDLPDRPGEMARGRGDEAA